MKDKFVASMETHFKTPEVKHRLEVCSEWSIVEHWFRMEIYMWLRKRGWTVPLVEGPYYTRLPARPSKKKHWNERPKWCDLVAIGPDSVHWMELKAIWYRKRTWKNNLYSALKDFLSLAAMDTKDTTELWGNPTGDASSYREFLQLHYPELKNGPHHRYSVCLLQAIPKSLLEEGSPRNVKDVSFMYLKNKIREVEEAEPKRFAWESEGDRKLAVRACIGASTVTPQFLEVGDVDRGERFPERNPSGRLVLAIWKVPEQEGKLYCPAKRYERK